MIRRILIPLDPSPYTDTALATGCTFARELGAELTGMVVLDIPGIEKSIGPVPLGGFYYAERLEKHREEEARERIRSLLSKFQEKCESEGVAHRETEHQGAPGEQIIRESLFYDAVVMGLRTFFHFETSDRAGDSLEEVLDHSITPIFGVPESFTFPNFPEEKIKVLVAFDGSIPSARALQRFAQFAFPEAMEVTLLNSDEDKDKAMYFLAQAEAYLRTHSIANIKKEWTTQDIIDTIDQDYLNAADFVVVGAHSKKGLFDFIVGSLTRHLIDAAKKPVLIVQ